MIAIRYDRVVVVDTQIVRESISLDYAHTSYQRLLQLDYRTGESSEDREQFKTTIWSIFRDTIYVQNHSSPWLSCNIY